MGVELITLAVQANVKLVTLTIAIPELPHPALTDAKATTQIVHQNAKPANQKLSTVMPNIKVVWLLADGQEADIVVHVVIVLMTLIRIA